MEGSRALRARFWAPRAAGPQWGLRPQDLRALWTRRAPLQAGSGRGLETGTPHPSVHLRDGGEARATSLIGECGGIMMITLKFVSEFWGVKSSHSYVV
ncbi:hypothetical protein NDU88_006107 [Pleurodeles waltl]|uniref:Uncharacterized protein n=1 Tax=Pleurodeles waltl TaxID=8319 RepID=A0AAV7MCC6_PLEWA|nr:hypothetical protein NDU88_006101 [Pleurodeles waltl]KAJ1101033.1 hypothetical protein NDU88_006107 [Pleurodeles waltl]